MSKVLESKIEKLSIIPYELGNQYRTQEGELVRFVAVHNQGSSYETMEDENGVNRYTRRDFGRVTGTAHDYSDPRNVPPMFYISNGHDIEMSIEDQKHVMLVPAPAED